eukprot:Gb_16508 [translate_table: standard]
MARILAIAAMEHHYRSYIHISISPLSNPNMKMHHRTIIITINPEHSEIPKSDSQGSNYYKIGGHWRISNEDGQLKEATDFLRFMHQQGIRVDSLTSTFLMKGCIDMKSLLEGKRFHVNMIKTGFKPGIYFETKLVILHAKFGSVRDARQLFDKMSERNVVSWTAMIAGYAQHKLGGKALELFSQMQLAGTKPNQFTFSSVLSACAGVSDLQLGKQVHACAISSGFESDNVFGNALIDMYAKCGDMKDAHQVFDTKTMRNEVSWTTMIAGYAKCGNIEDARLMFDEMPEKSVVSWNAMIAGYAQHGHGEKALMLFEQMKQLDMMPTFSTYASILSVCAGIAALEKGKGVHAHIIKRTLEPDVILGSTLVDMYAKCGSLKDAWHVFVAMPQKNVVSWTAMIDGYGKHGHAKEAIQLFEQMQQIGMKPNDVTFLSVLFACSHAGLVDDGLHFFHCMRCNHNIAPRTEHYACMVDLLGRAGRLDEAHSFINKMPIEPDADVWGALLGACRVHANIELGQHAAERVFQLKPQNIGTYVALSNVYAAAGMWDGAAKVIKTMKNKGIKMEPGCSWIEVKKKVHVFRAGDRSHPQTEQIFATIEKLARQMKEVGYVPEANLVFHDMEEKQKELILSRHSERLAIAFGLISTPSGALIRIIKNLRVCIDCHNAIKFISKIVDREIVVRDANRFHHFKNGLCSCGDYW